MARRRLTREESRQRTRELLLAAAAEVFSRRGFHAASVEEVAETAGFSKGAVYSNFASKDELFLALLDRHLEQELRALAQGLAAIAGDAGPGDARTGAGDPGPSFARRLAEGRQWNVLLMEFWLYAMRDERARERLAARYRAAREEVAARLRSRHASGGSGPALPVEELAWALLALGSGLVLHAYLQGPAALPEDLYRHLAGRLLADDRGPGEARTRRE